MKYPVLQLPYRITGMDDTLPVRVQRNLDAIADAIAQMQKYENAYGLGANDLLTNTVADERLGASIAGFKRPSVAYKQDGTQVLANLPRYEYARQAAPVWSDLFNVDDLAQYTSGGDVAATWSISGGVLSGTGGTQATLIKNSLTLADCEIEVNCDQAHVAGIVARYQDNNNYYLLETLDDSSPTPTQNLKIWKRVSGTFTNIINTDVTWVRGTSKLIKFSLNGNLLEVWFDGVKVISVTDTTFTSGGVGLRNNNATAVRFLDFKVYQASQALMMEEGTTNIVATWPTGFAGSGDAGGSATDIGVQTGAAGSTVRLANTGATGYSYTNYNACYTLSPSTTYTLRFKVRGTVATGKFIYFVLSKTGTLIQTQASPTLTANFQTITKTFTTTADITGTNQYIRFDHNGNDTGYIEIAEVTLIQKGYALGFPGYSTSRSAETCAMPVSGIFAKNNWAVEMTYTPKANFYSVTSGHLWFCVIDGSNYYSIRIEQTTGYIALHVVSGGVTKSIIGTTPIAVDTQYFITASGDGANMRLCVNGNQIGSDLAYTEPVGALPTLMYIGTNETGAVPCNGLIDDLRFSSRARTYREHYDAWKKGTPLEVDDVTTLKQDFSGTLRPTVRSRTREEEIPITADKMVTIIDDRDSAIVYTPSPTPPGADMNPTGPWYQWYGSMFYYDKTIIIGDGARAETQSLEYSFTGSSISIIANTGSDCGKIDVYIDNVLDATVDLYNASWSLGRDEVYKISNLSYATHTIKIVVRTDKNPASTAYFFFFDGLRIGRGLNIKQLDISVARQVVNIVTNANGYGSLNVGGYEPGGQTGPWLMLCITGVRLYNNPNPDSLTANKPKVGFRTQLLYVWDGPVSSTVQLEYSILLITK